MKYEIQQQSFEKGYGGFWYDRTGDYFIDDSDTLEEALSIAKWYAQRVTDGLMNSNVYVWKLNENGEEEQLMYKYVSSLELPVSIMRNRPQHAFLASS